MREVNSKVRLRFGHAWHQVALASIRAEPSWICPKLPASQSSGHLVTLLGESIFFILLQVWPGSGGRSFWDFFEPDAPCGSPQRGGRRGRPTRETLMEKKRLVHAGRSGDYACIFSGPGHAS